MRAQVRTRVVGRICAQVTAAWTVCSWKCYKWYPHKTLRTDRPQNRRGSRPYLVAGERAHDRHPSPAAVAGVRHARAFLFLTPRVRPVPENAAVVVVVVGPADRATGRCRRPPEQQRGRQQDDDGGRQTGCGHCGPDVSSRASSGDRRSEKSGLSRTRGGPSACRGNNGRCVRFFFPPDKRPKAHTTDGQKTHTTDGQKRAHTRPTDTRTRLPHRRRRRRGTRPSYVFVLLFVYGSRRRIRFSHSNNWFCRRRRSTGQQLCDAHNAGGIGTHIQHTTTAATGGNVPGNFSRFLPAERYEGYSKFFLCCRYVLLRFRPSHFKHRGPIRYPRQWFPTFYENLCWRRKIYKIYFEVKTYSRFSFCSFVVISPVQGDEQTRRYRVGLEFAPPGAKIITPSHRRPSRSSYTHFIGENKNCVYLNIYIPCKKHVPLITENIVYFIV